MIQQPKLEGTLGVQYGYDALTAHTAKLKKIVQRPNVVVTTSQATSPSATKYYYTGS